MRYEILGPLRVRDNRGCAALSARKTAKLLAVLLARAEQLVTVDEIIFEIWGENPPRSATGSLYVYVSQLRKFLHCPARTENPIVTRAPGYILRLGVDEVDLHDFQELTREGRRHLQGCRYEQSVESFEAALGLWRGPAFGNLQDGRIVGGFVTWLEEARLECEEMLIEANLFLGRHREIIGRLYSLVAEHPLRETFHRQLMLALYRSERQADALKVYQAARDMLNDQLGLEPGRALRDLQHAILRADDQLDAEGAI